MDGRAGSGLSWGSSVVLELFLHLSLHHFLICVKIGILVFFFPCRFVCYVTASVAVPRVGLTTFPGLIREVLRV